MSINTTIVPKPFVPKKGAYVTFDTRIPEVFAEASPAPVSETIPPTTLWPATTWPCSTRFTGVYPEAAFFNAKQALAVFTMDSKLYNGLLDWLAHADDLEVVIDPGSVSSAKIANTVLDVVTLNPALVPGVQVPRIASMIRDRYFGSRYETLLTKIATQQDWSKGDRQVATSIVIGYITYLTETQGSKQAARCLASIRRAVFSSLMPVNGPTLANGKITIDLNTQNQQLKDEISQNPDMQRFLQVWLRWWALNNTQKTTIAGDDFTVDVSHVEKGSPQDIILNGSDDEGGAYTVAVAGASEFTGDPDAAADESLIPEEFAISDSKTTDEFNELTEDTEIVLSIPNAVRAPKIDWTSETDIYPIISITGAVAQGFSMYSEKDSIPGFTPLSVDHSRDAADVNRNRPEGTQYKTKSMKEKRVAEALDAPVVEILFPERSWEKLWARHIADLKAKLYTALAEADAYQYTVRDGDGKKVKVYALLDYVDASGFTMPNVSDAVLSPSTDAASTFTTFAIPTSFCLPVDETAQSALDLVKVKSSLCELDIAGEAYKKAHDAAVTEYIRRLKDSDVPLDPDDKGFPWWILGVVGALAVLTVLIANVVQDREKDKGRAPSTPFSDPTSNFR